MNKKITFADIPEEIKNKYNITLRRCYDKDNSIYIYLPVFINISFDNLIITDNLYTIKFNNNKCIIRIWKNTYFMHINIK